MKIREKIANEICKIRCAMCVDCEANDSECFNNCLLIADYILAQRKQAVIETAEKIKTHYLYGVKMNMINFLDKLISETNTTKARMQ